jgi:sulfopyruvate decarboxylase subunit alpha
MSERLSGGALIRAIKRAGVRFVVALPDRTTSENVLKPLLADPELRVVQICKEDEGVSICAGLHAAGQRAVLLMQYTGLLDSVNALRGIAVDGRNPVCMIVGLLNKEPGVAPKRSKWYGVRTVEPVLDALEVEHQLIETRGDEEQVAPAIERAYEAQKPVVLLVGLEPSS